ncbi:hypothetical protein MAPG_11673 [Magnaporthiopsis poae ATCC 64411]|uniref:Uncharacterized protein n=1 Tax=Magnaporthiopsis poae (strain ATCC 64411 / 73-15) TaxID=644358 RepID=A0A0C4EFW4_MAGP6|nr:hypothetical protein MAPG_11673 [Magnaporthiopsis poae ATCC 64411]
MSHGKQNLSNWRARQAVIESKTPCSRLCHDQKCLKPPGQCGRSHDERVVAAWKAGKGKGPCPHQEEGCWNAPNYLCLYPHTHDEIFPEVPRLAKALEDLEEISAVNMDALTSQDDARISNLMGLSSFNTLDKADEIAIPGAPAFFNPPKISIKIAADNRNKVLQKPPEHTHSLDALVTSVETMTDGSALRSADIVASCGALRKIFDFMRSAYKEPGSTLEGNPISPKWLPHRLDLQWREPGTLYLSPWANDPRFRHSWGMGQGFERMVSKFDQSDPVISRSSSHHQVVSYNLGGLRCVVQAEADAYSCDCGHLPEKRPQEVLPSDPFELPRPSSARGCSARRASTPSPVIAPTPSPKTGRGKGKGRRPSSRRSALIIDFNLLQMDDAGDTGSECSLPSEPGFPPTPDSAAIQTSRNSRLIVHKTGDTQPPIPISCLLEIKTRNYDSIITIESWAAQLYFAGRRQLFSARHYRGDFHPSGGCMVPGLDTWLEEWAGRDSIKAAMSRTVALLQTIREKLTQLADAGDISLGPEGNGLSLLLGYEDEKEGEGGGKVPFARLYLRNDGMRLVP